MFKAKKDLFRKSRGGTSRLLDISCANCSHHVAFYQKDGPGQLKRMYVDRFIGATPSGSELLCGSCGNQLGVLTLYKREKRPAYHLRNGAVAKSAVAADKLPTT